jgi:hypothetical protein
MTAVGHDVTFLSARTMRCAHRIRRDLQAVIGTIHQGEFHIANSSGTAFR